MIIKTNKVDKNKLVYHSHGKKELSRMLKAFHSNCKHIKGKFFGCAGVIDLVNDKSIFFRESYRKKRIPVEA